jgi:hypothetical protein
MAVSYVSQILKSNPYVLPVDLNLTAKILQFKETNFKQNASKIQQSIDQAQSTDLIKSEDKDYLQNKVSSLVNGINGSAGLDLGDINVANQLNQMTSDIYSDQDLLESITSTQKVRKLTAMYEKMQTDPKLKGTFATQNMQWDMQGVNEWLNNGERTTADNGYKGTSTPTPFTDVDKLMVERAKVVKANYTKSTTKDGIYIHNVTGEEVTADQIKNELKAYVSENPQLQQQAQINSWFLNRNVTGETLYKDAIQRTTSTRDFIKKDYDEALRLYEVMPQDQKLKYAATIESKRQNLSAYDKSIKEIETEGVKGFEKNKDAYRTSLYIDNMTGHLAQSMSYNKFTDDVKPDLAQLAMMKNQLEAAKVGAEWVPDPTSTTGWALVKSNNPIVNTKDSKKSVGTDGFDITTQGQLSPGLNTENKVEWTDKKVAETIITKNDDKQKLFTDLIDELLVLNPNLASIYGKETSKVALVDFVKGKNDPNRFEIEDLKDVSSKWMTPAQTEYISNLYKSFQAIKEGKPSLINLTATQLDNMKRIQSINEEVDFYFTLLEKARGGATDLTSGERAAIVEQSTGKNFKPSFISAKSAKGVNGGMEPIFGVDFETEAPTLKVIYNEDTKKFIPMDGKEHKYNNITIPVEGVDMIKLEGLTVPGGGRVEKSEIDPKSLYGVHVIKTKEQQNYTTATEKIKKSGKAPDPEAYKILNEVSGFYNYALPADIEAQTKDGTLNLLKTGIFQEYENGSTSIMVKDLSNNTLAPSEGQQTLVGFDKGKSYISRIGTSSSDPTKLEIETTLISQATSKVPAREVAKLTRELRPDEAKQLGIALPPREYLIDNTMVKYKGRTAPSVYIPQTQDQSPQLVIDMEVVYLKGSNSYVPQIKVPINGKMQYITLAGGNKDFPNISGSSVNEVKSIFQNWITNLYTQGVKDNNTLYQYIKSVK